MKVENLIRDLQQLNPELEIAAWFNPRAGMEAHGPDLRLQEEFSVRESNYGETFFVLGAYLAPDERKEKLLLDICPGTLQQKSVLKR